MTKSERRITTDDTTSKLQGRIPGDHNPPRPPKLFAWLASAATISLIIVTQYLPRGNGPVLRGAGVCLLLLAGVFIFWPFYLLAKHGGQDGDAHMQASYIVDRGLYAVTRHPQYLGYIFLACGFALLSQHWVALLLATVGSTFFWLQAVREERYCLARFGKPYERYRRRVPRFNAILGLVRSLRGGGE